MLEIIKNEAPKVKESFKVGDVVANSSNDLYLVFVTEEKTIGFLVLTQGHCSKEQFGVIDSGISSVEEVIARNGYSTLRVIKSTLTVEI